MKARARPRVRPPRPWASSWLAPPPKHMASPHCSQEDLRRVPLGSAAYRNQLAAQFATHRGCAGSAHAQVLMPICGCWRSLIQRVGVQPCKHACMQGSALRDRCYTRFVGYFEKGPRMHSELNVLIVNPLLGTRGLMDLAGKLLAAVEVAAIGDVHGSMPCVLSAGVTARLRRDPRVWDWVISVRDGAGVAAQMVSRGQPRCCEAMVHADPSWPGSRCVERRRDPDHRPALERTGLAHRPVCRRGRTEPGV